MMGFFPPVSVLLLLLILQIQRGNAFAEDESVESASSLRRNAAVRSCLVCNVAAADVQYGYNIVGPVMDFLACISETTQEVFLLDQLPKAFLRQYNRQIYSGKSRICIRQGRVNRTSSKVVIPANSTIEMLPAVAPVTRRRLVPTLGQSTLLVVRVTSTFGEDPGLSADDLRGTVFGTGPNASSVNPVSQYGLCSNGKWNLVPATGNDIVNGVLEVQYNGTIAGGNIVGPLQTAIKNLVLQRTGASSLAGAANHILFCLPPGSEISANNSNWIAFSYLNNVVSFFQRGWCQRMSAVMHEVGHQVGMRHSGKNLSEYGDQSCLMGSSYPVNGRPQECFNGHKHSIAGWFDDAKVTVNPLLNGPWVGNLVAFVDYSLRGQIPQSTPLILAGDLFIQFNSIKKYNYQVVQNGNRVTVVKNNATQTFSDILVGMVSGQTFTYANFSGSGLNVTIQVCSVTLGTVDYAKLSIYMQDGVQTSQCSRNLFPTAPPTPKPTQLPTSPPPTRQPTRLPTPLPTSRPTSRPTSLPTRRPPPRATPPPTRSPTPFPTPPPTRPPTPPPTSSPTPPPTSSPTPTPSSSPTPTPSSSPTPTPSSSPTPTPSSSPTPPPTTSPTNVPSFSPSQATPSPTLSTPPPTPLPTLSPSAFPTTQPPPPITPAPSITGTPGGQPSPTEVKVIDVPIPLGYCFSRANTVEVQHKGVVSMKDLQIGDLVRSGDGKFDIVYSFGHYNPSTKAEYIQMHLQSRRQPLEISKDHMLFVEGTAIPASNVTVGDRVNLGTGGTAQVVKISTVVRSGAYAPFTMSGVITVSGVQSSSFVTLQEGSHVLMLGGYRTPISMHWLAHVFQSPHRLVCLMSPESCQSESYSADGISKWVEGPLHVSQWLLQQNGIVMTAVVIPALLLALVSYAVEVCFVGSQPLLLFIVCLLATTSFYLSRLRKDRKLLA